MRAVLALCLSTLLSLPAVGSDPNPSPDKIKNQAARLKSGKQIHVKLRTGEKIKGVLLSTEPTALRMHVGAAQAVQERTVAFNDIRELSSPMPAWKGIVIVVAVVAAVGLILMGVASSSA